MKNTKNSGLSLTLKVALFVWGIFWSILVINLLGDFLYKPLVSYLENFLGGRVLSSIFFNLFTYAFFIYLAFLISRIKDKTRAYVYSCLFLLIPIILFLIITDRSFISIFIVSMIIFFTFVFSAFLVFIIKLIKEKRFKSMAVFFIAPVLIFALTPIISKSYDLFMYKVFNVRIPIYGSGFFHLPLEEYYIGFLISYTFFLSLFLTIFFPDKKYKYLGWTIGPILLLFIRVLDFFITILIVAVIGYLLGRLTLLVYNKIQKMIKK